MPPSQRNSSFIPKRNPTQKAKKPRTQRLYLFSVIASALFIASLLASAAVFIYERQVQSNLATAITNFNSAANSFSEADFARVTEFSERVTTIQQLVRTHVSLVSLLTILEQNTVGTAQLSALTVERTGRDEVVASANVLTSTIDTALFQRDQYERTPELGTVDIADIAFITGQAGAIVPGTRLPVSLEMEFSFAAEEILYTPTFTSQSFVAPAVPMDQGLVDSAEEVSGDATEEASNNDEL